MRGCARQCAELFGLLGGSAKISASRCGVGELEDTESHDARAFFVCALALAAPRAATQIFEGRVYGSLAFPPRGHLGFGYDPIFVPEGYRMTFGEMPPAEKHAMSHRARAFAKFVHSAIDPGTEQ